MKKVTTKELMQQLQDKLIIKLGEDEILCPECKGLRFVLIQNENSAHIESCKRCMTGKVYVCEHCGDTTMSGHCKCYEASRERDLKAKVKQDEKDLEAFSRAEKINYKDYKGYYLLDDDEHLRDKDDLAEWIYDKLRDGSDVPEYLWANEGTQHFSIDLLDVISDQCEDGYEGMYDHLDTNSPYLSEAQALIDKWEIEQGDNLYIFSETRKKAIIIKDLIEEIKKEMGHQENEGE